jgi:hypothetical protein
MLHGNFLYRRRTIAVLAAGAAALFLLFTILSLYSLQPKTRPCYDVSASEWNASAVNSANIDFHHENTLERIPEYNVEAYDTPSCAARHGREYLESFRKNATGLHS